MDPSRKIALVGGLFFLLTFVHVAFLAPNDSILNDTDYLLAGDDDAAVRLGDLIQVIEIIANVATSFILFQVLKRQHEAIALGYVAVRIFESAITAVGTCAILRRSSQTPGSLPINRALRPYRAMPRYLTLMPGALLRRV